MSLFDVDVDANDSSNLVICSVFLKLQKKCRSEQKGTSVPVNTQTNIVKKIKVFQWCRINSIGLFPNNSADIFFVQNAKVPAQLEIHTIQTRSSAGASEVHPLVFYVMLSKRCGDNQPTSHI